MTPQTKWALLVPVDYATAIIGRLFAPFVVLFATKDDHLPKWLSWFDTPDNPLSGDGGWKTEHMQWRFKFPPMIARYLGRVGWLWRNNMYGFDIDVMGAKVLATDTLVVTGDIATSDRPGHSGSVTRKLYRDGKLIYWQWYFIHIYAPGRCVRVNLGWKLWGVNGSDKNIQYTVYINPVKGAH